MLKEIYDFLMYLTGWPLAAVLISGGTFFTFRTAFVQLRLLVESFRVVLEKPAQQGSVSSFGALMISTASRVGTEWAHEAETASHRPPPPPEQEQGRS